MKIVDSIKRIIPTPVKVLIVSLRNKSKKKFRRKPLRTLEIAEDKLLPYKEKHREAVNSVDNWIDEKAFEKSHFKYGVHERFYDVLSKPINNDTTYTDIIAYLGGKYFEKVTYLEIGVSVGKNFYQMINSPLNYNEIYGFEIEEINPILEKRLTFVKKEEWNNGISKIKTENTSLTEYRNKNNTPVFYLSGDIWEEQNWEKLSGKKFNVIFSDAEHTAMSIVNEFDMFVKHNILDDKFVIVWDDIHGDMVEGFHAIYEKYKEQLGFKEFRLINSGGWLGNHYPIPHCEGIIANFTF